MPVVERELVDGQIAHAKTLADGLSGDRQVMAKIAISLVEAIVRQVRDADDTVAVTLAPAIEQGLGDLSIQVSNVAQSIPQHKQKGGLF